MAVTDVKHLVLYDGLCALCNRVVNYLLAIDRRGTLHYAPLQGQTAGRLRQDVTGIPAAAETILFVRNYGSENETCYDSSEAVLQIFDIIGGGWRILTYSRILRIGICLIFF